MSGAILTRNSNFVAAQTETIITWDNVDQFEKVYFDPAVPDRLTVPEGVTHVEIMFNAYASSGGLINGDTLTRILKNGVAIKEIYHNDQTFGAFGHRSGLLEVTPGDYFQIILRTYVAGSPSYDSQFLSVQIVEGARAGFVVATPAANVSTNGTTTIVWASSYDNRNTHSLENFVVPYGISYSVISFTPLNIIEVAYNVTYALLIDGVEVRKYRTTETSGWNSGAPSFGLINHVPGAVIQIRMTGSDVGLISAGNSKLSIEYIAASSNTQIVGQLPTQSLTSSEMTITVEDFVRPALETMSITAPVPTIIPDIEQLIIPQNTSFIVDWTTDLDNELTSSEALSSTANDNLYIGASNTNEANHILGSVAYYADKLRSTGNGDKTITIYFTRYLDGGSPLPSNWGAGITDVGQAVYKLGPMLASSLTIANFGANILPAIHNEGDFTQAPSIFSALEEVVADRVNDSIERVIIMKSGYDMNTDYDYASDIQGDNAVPTRATMTTLRSNYFSIAKGLKDNNVDINYWNNWSGAIAHDASYLSSTHNPLNPSWTPNRLFNPWELTSSSERNPGHLVSLASFGDDDGLYNSTTIGLEHQTTFSSVRQQMYGEIGVDVYQHFNSWDNPWVATAFKTEYEPYQDNFNQVEFITDEMFELASEHRGVEYTGPHRYWRINILETLDNALARTSAIAFRDVAWATTNTGFNIEGSGTWLASSNVADAPNTEDHSDLTSTWTASASLPQWIGYDFGVGNAKQIENIIVGSFATGAADDPTGTPIKWDIEWSDDGTAWNTLSSIDMSPDYATYNLVDRANNTGYVPPFWYEGDRRIFPIFYMQQFRAKSSSAVNTVVDTFLHGMYIPQGYTLVLNSGGDNFIESYFSSATPPVGTNQKYKIWKTSNSATSTLSDYFNGQPTNEIIFTTAGGYLINGEYEISGPEYIEIWADTEGASNSTIFELILPLQQYIPNPNRIDITPAVISLTSFDVTIMPITIDAGSITLTPATMAISMIGSGASTIDNGSATIDVAYPANILENDLMILSIMARSNVTIPTGWTLVKEQFVTGAEFDQRGLVMTKRATGAESGNITLTQVGTGRFLADMSNIRHAYGVKSVTSGTYTTSSNSMITGPINGITSDTIAIATMTSPLSQVGDSVTVEAGYTLQTNASGDGASRLVTAYQEISAGFTDTEVTFTKNAAGTDQSESWIVVIIE